ncbi:error-prone DNA polymerase [Siccirubricoccus phaeus]|uniref:error-prone DNA polymerase n=1 Tax=Siccirubricoccus phaeus TaxID=2595053 RepID=UPI0011F400CF|nr:error-prone DNA polymerase [Siccirubricoccus phaeus]
MIGFAELGARSHFSLLDGASSPQELVATAKVYGHAGLAICDTNSLAGVVRGHVAAKEVDLPFVVGSRLRLVDGSEYLVWPTDRASYGRLTRLLSEARMAAPKGDCPITPKAMIAAAQGWVVAAMPPSVLDASFAQRMADEAVVLRGKLALPLFLAAPWTFRGDDRKRLDWLAALAEEVGGGLLASTDPRYHHPDRRRLADVLACIARTVTIDQLGWEAERNGERCLKPLAEMQRLYEGHPEALANTLRVLDVARGFSLDQLRYEYPDEILDPDRTPQETLEARTAEAAAERWPDGVTADIQGRLDHELKLIAQLGYAPYFLTVHEIVRFARGQGILCQGRGSAANSAVCYALGVTAVDPAKHDLLFERFVSASRNEPPDIDIDFEHERREEVIQHIYNRYGRDRAAICGTVIRYRGRSAIREVGKAMGLSEDITGRLAKLGWSHRDADLGTVAEAEGFRPAEDPRLAMALELAEELQGSPRHIATHVGGFVITRGPLVELAVVTNAAMEDRTTLEWDKDDIDALGMLKVDVLGLGMLSCLRRGLDLLREHKALSLGLADMPPECPDTYAMLRRGDSLGVFQVESRAQMNMLPRLRPKEFYDLVIQVAIVRPGPIQGDMVHPYLRRRAGKEVVEFPSPSPEHGPPDELERVLGKTLGVPLFQEQAMKVAIVAARFTPDEADQLRRAMATFKHTGGVSSYRERLVQGMVKRGYDPDFAERVFSQIEGFGSYGFPESHAASFAHLVYASSWIKCHHPGIFACALLNSQPMGFYAPAQIVDDARRHGVDVRPIDVNASGWDHSLELDEGSKDRLALRLGMRIVAGLAEVDGRAIEEAPRAGNGVPYTSIAEVVMRSGVGRRAIEALAAADAFRSLPQGRRKAIWDATGVEGQQLALFEVADDVPMLVEPSATLPHEREGEAIVSDYVSSGLTLGRHPLALLRPILGGMGCVDTRALGALRQGQRVKHVGMVITRQRPGEGNIVFITTEDEHGTANLVVYARIAERDRVALIGGRLLLVQGRVERTEEATEVPIIHVIAERLVDRSDLLDRLGEIDGASSGLDRALGRADEVRRPDPGSRRPRISQKTRDFR